MSKRPVKKKVTKKTVKIQLSPRKTASLSLRYAKALAKARQRNSDKLRKLLERQVTQEAKLAQRFVSRGLQVA